MRICVVGLGSIAKRHIKNIRKLYGDVKIDILRHTKSEDGSEYGNCVYSEKDLLKKYDAIFITNPTNMHIDTLRRLIDKSDAFFIEKPLRPLEYREDSIESLPKDKIYYVACPLRYTGIVQYLKDSIDWDRAFCLRAISSSYLPEWRPEVDYSTCYSARKELGGGVAADLIHEWDYISYLIGKPYKVHAVQKKLSGLRIDVEDVALYIGEYKDKLVEVHLDYFGRQTLRNLYIFMDDDTVYCDFISSTIKYLKSGRMLTFDEKRDDYQIEELKHFFEIMQGKTDNDNSVYEAESLMRLLER